MQFAKNKLKVFLSKFFRDGAKKYQVAATEWFSSTSNAFLPNP